DGYDNHVFLKLFSFELSHLHSSKLSFSIILPQNELIGNFATEPVGWILVFHQVFSQHKDCFLLR
ncbi:hypothetical protein, partial [Enterococcus faecalis]|uniref:hypothetical protein n=1 Tax=Enterococcus faecalis TaxID=1351 RepID=UPI0039E8D710